jgi:hypothetical protein
VKLLLSFCARMVFSASLTASRSDTEGRGGESDPCLVCRAAD